MLNVMEEIKQFMNLVLNVAFGQMHLYKQSNQAQSRFKELLSDEVGEAPVFAEKLKNYFDEFIHETY